LLIKNCIFVEWHQGKSGRLTLHDIDNISDRSNGMIRLNIFKMPWYNIKNYCHYLSMHHYCIHSTHRWTHGRLTIYFIRIIVIVPVHQSHVITIFLYFCSMPQFSIWITLNCRLALKVWHTFVFDICISFELLFSE
jgi:hypothetical protein